MTIDQSTKSQKSVVTLSSDSRILRWAYNLAYRILPFSTQCFVVSRLHLIVISQTPRTVNYNHATQILRKNISSAKA